MELTIQFSLPFTAADPPQAGTNSAHPPFAQPPEGRQEVWRIKTSYGPSQVIRGSPGQIFITLYSTERDIWKTETQRLQKTRLGLRVQADTCAAAAIALHERIAE